MRKHPNDAKLEKFSLASLTLLTVRVNAHAENTGGSMSGRLEGEFLGNRISPTGEYIINLGERNMYHVQFD